MAKKLYRKFRKVVSNGSYATKSSVTFGRFGLKAVSFGRVTKNQIEATRKVIVRKLREQNGIIFINIYPSLPVTKKPAEVRMGSGKGGVDHYVSNVRLGQILFEIDCVTEDLARECFESAAKKLPIKCSFIKRKFLESV